MFQDKKDSIDHARRRFEAELERRSPDARRVGEEYMESLEDYLRLFEHGPAADPQVARVDTTGQVRDTEDFADWVWKEARRVRGVLRELPGEEHPAPGGPSTGP
jgi:hypothetical protein